MKPHDYVDLGARKQPRAPLAIRADQPLTYAQARDASNRIAHAIMALGLRPGDRMAILMRNSVEAVLLLFGALKAGVIPTPINPRLKPPEWARICQDSEARLLVSDWESTDGVESFRGQLGDVRGFIVAGGPRSGWQEFEAWNAEQSCDRPNVTLTDEDDALQMYTSGTTGQPKSAVLTHRAVTASITQFGKVAPFQPHDRFLMIMPLFHAAGIMAMLHAVSWGASLVIRSSFVPRDTVEALDSGGVTVAMMAPTMLQTCLGDVADIAQREFRDLRLIIYGASPINEETLRHAMRVFGCDFAQRYGTTETLSLTWLDAQDHRLALEDRPQLLRSAGRPLPGIQLRVVDSRGQEMPIGESGEFIASGPQLMRGYWKSKTEPSLTLEGQRWLRTGDAGFVDADGYVYICDRVKDVIVSGGENIYPHEIEDVLREHPDVCDTAVIGVPDIKWGETVKAIVMPRAGVTVSSEQLIDYCRRKLAAFKVPHSVDFVSSIPRSSNGKLLKDQIRKPYWKDHQRRV